MITLRRVKWILTILGLALIPATILIPGDRELPLIIVLAVCLLILLGYDLRMVLNPMIRIQDSLKEDRVEETLQEVTRSQGTTDVGSIFRGVVNHYTTKQDAEIYSRQIELAALQSQINPHFLYNTLDAIRGQAIQDNNRDVAMMIQTLSAFFGTASAVRETQSPCVTNWIMSRII